jgi:hypothetical protein
VLAGDRHKVCRPAELNRAVAALEGDKLLARGFEESPVFIVIDHLGRCPGAVAIILSMISGGVRTTRSLNFSKA